MKQAVEEIYIRKDLFEQVFINTNRFKYTENPTQFNASYLEVLLQQPLIGMMNQEQGDIDLSVLPLIVKALIISECGAELYLVDEYDKRKVTIPGGHVSSFRCNEYGRNFEFIIFNLIRELCEEFKIGRQTKLYDKLNVPPIEEILHRGGFDVREIRKPLYTLNDLLGLTIYVPIIVSRHKIPDNAVVVDVESYRDCINKDMRFRIERECLYKNDIRSGDCSYILDNIIQTHQLFK